MDIIKVTKEDPEWIVKIDGDDIEDLAEAFLALFTVVQENERFGNAWNYAMEMNTDAQEPEGKA